MMQRRDYQHACHDAILKAWGIAPWSEMNLWREHYALAAELGHAPWFDQSAIRNPQSAFQSVLAVLGTAAGKTIIAADLIQTLVSLGKRVLFCADTDELCQQPLEKIARVTGIRPQLEKADAKAYALAGILPHSAIRTPQFNVCVASVQTLSDPARLQDFIARWGVPDVVIHDEAHSGPERAAEIDSHFPGVLRLGLTATPYRAGRGRLGNKVRESVARSRTLSKWYDVVAFRMDALDLIRQGWVTPLSVQGLDLGIDWESIWKPGNQEGENSDFHGFMASEFDSFRRRIEPVYRRIARILRDRIIPQSATRNPRSVLVFHPLVKSSRLFVDVCNAEGLPAAHCDGESRDRAQLLAAFERGELRVISNSSVFSKGVDFIRADCLLNLDLTRSPGKYRQRVGRVMRALPGVTDGLATAADRRAAIAASAKPEALILDVLGQSDRFGVAGPAMLVARDDFERAALQRRITPAKAQPLDELARAARADALLLRREEKLLRALRANSLRDPQSEIRHVFEPGSREAQLDALFAAFQNAA